MKNWRNGAKPKVGLLNMGVKLVVDLVMGSGLNIMMSAEHRLATSYMAVRAAVQSMEEAIEQGKFSEAEAKDLDKAVVVIKVGAKIAKKILRSRGFKRIGAIAKGNK